MNGEAVGGLILAPTPDAAFAAWEDGDLAPEKALRDICEGIALCEESLRPLEAMVKACRSLAERIVLETGEHYDLPGFGKVSFAPASRRLVYDQKQVREFQQHLSQLGYDELAGRLARCQVETTRDGYLLIKRERRG